MLILYHVQDFPKKSNSTSHSAQVDALHNEFFSDLADLKADDFRREAAIRQAPESREYRSARRTSIRVEDLVKWVKLPTSQILWIDGNSILRHSELSAFFATPLLVLGECDYETMVILRYDCATHASSSTSRSDLLVKALIYQIMERSSKALQIVHSAISTTTMSNLEALWNVLTNCLEVLDVACGFIIIENIDYLSHANAEDGHPIIKKLNALVQDSRRIIKIMLTASLATGKILDEKALTMFRRTGAVDTDSTYQEALFFQKLSEIDQKRCKTIAFADLAMLYRQNTMIYSIEDGELRAFMVRSCRWVAEGPLELRSELVVYAWSVDHNGIGYCRMHHEFVISRFSGERTVESLRYIPAGYLPDENEKRSRMLACGKSWWEYSSRVHHVVLGTTGSQVGS